MLIDSHAHLCSSALEADREEVLDRAQAAGIEAIVNIATHPDELKRGLTLSKERPWIYNVGSTTPHDAEKEGELHFETFAAHARAGDLVAVGETGLDYYYWKDSAKRQQHFLRAYLRLAHECALPVVIHCRDAFADFFRILDDEKPVPGVLHCFTGTLEEAEKVIARDWYLSLSGIATFKKSEELREVARRVPLNRLLIETDSPYLAPSRQRGKRNEPAYLVETAQCLAEARGLTLKEFARATRQNAHDLFGLT
ncbi:MAG: D-aminoacyl-tRNA deacylase [Chlamydiales bacterium]|nr:D-aminoacyl-tRNA deacylase [Chlamydiales bacterium]